MPLIFHGSSRIRMYRVMVSMAMFLFFLFLLTATSAAPSSLQQAPEPVVAIVFGVEIVHNDIAVTVDEAEFRYKLKTEHSIEIGQEHEIEALRQQLEIGRLASEIRQIVVRRVKARLGVSVSDAEVLSRWQRLTRGVDLDSAARQQRDHIAPLLAALKTVHEDGKGEREVYNTFLSDKMTFREWEIQARYYRTPNRLRILEQALEQTGQDLLNPDPGFRAMLEGEQLSQAIDEEIAKNDPSFAEYVKLRDSNLDDERLRAYPPNYLEEMRANWWGEQYQEAKIEILDGHYNEVLDLFVQSKKS